jgi:dipeptidyl aminopeptidase/acylaminoacyl peptidase
MRSSGLFLLLSMALPAPLLARPSGYRLPPQGVIDVIDAPRPPVEFPGPDGQWLVIAQDDDIRSIKELARPFLKFAGLRVYPHNNSQVRTSFYKEPFLLQVTDRTTRKLTLPAGSMLGAPIWSSDAKFVALPRYTDKGVELWVADVATGQARNVTGPVVNATLTAGYRQIQRARETLNASWTPDSRRLLVLRTVDGRGAAPEPPAVPPGPVVMDTSRNYSRENAWEDLSKNTYDEALFEYYGTAQMIEIDVTSGAQVKVGPPGLYIAPPAVSPDGRFILMQRVKRPYSYWVRYREFSVSVEIWDRHHEPCEDDDSQASEPIESLKLFHALRGHGATARLVLLPRENHAFAARESILDVLAQKIEWFDRYVKNKGTQPVR